MMLCRAFGWGTRACRAPSRSGRGVHRHLRLAGSLPTTFSDLLLELPGRLPRGGAADLPLALLLLLAVPAVLLVPLARQRLEPALGLVLERRHPPALRPGRQQRDVPPHLGLFDRLGRTAVGISLGQRASLGHEPATATRGLRSAGTGRPSSRCLGGSARVRRGGDDSWRTSYDRRQLGVDDHIVAV